MQMKKEMRRLKKKQMRRETKGKRKKMKKERKGKEKWMVSEDTIDIYFLRFLQFFQKCSFVKEWKKQKKS